MDTVKKDDDLPIMKAPTGKKPNFMMKKAEKPKYPSYLKSN
tara:strand:- start:1421 stop:1543 length:123 start_codon:yes stop_codon:yes gene_type:complete